MDDYLSINITLVGRPFKLKVKPEEEEMVRLAANEINEKVLEYQQSFPSKDKQDFLTMMVLQLKVDLLRVEGAKSQTEEWSEKLDALDALLTKNLIDL
ncbi:MAG TPA: cell division protein ZapA [Chitinophagales bacterium]|nr:cell division protein ZapA [Chitinophagales bacterium]